jgi:tRNA uridine 5-carbamoylmethylation protein Kti12
MYTNKEVFKKEGNLMKSKELQDIYFRFLNLVRSIEELPDFPKLDATENELLNMVASQWKKGERLLVSDAIAMRQIGSPATLHARLKQLREKDMINYVIETDGRKKYIEPTDMALKYFSQISDCMVQASKA